MSQFYPASGLAAGLSRGIRVRTPDGDVAEVRAVGLPIETILADGSVPPSVLDRLPAAV